MRRSPYVGPVHYEPRGPPKVQVRTSMSQRDEVQKFEQGRIRFLQEERLHIQKKTFTKWMNSFLTKARMEVEDLFVDLADGRKLLKLLEIISGEKLGKPNNGRMRVHKIENVNKSLSFLHTKVRLESIGAEDIVDGNPRLILGLIWTIILRFQIQEIEIDVDEENESSEKKSAKDALLLWAQRKTSGYPNVEITDFSGSWRNGLGFNALIHSHRPDLFDFNSLNPNKHIENLNHAFDVANNELGIPPLLDAEDIDNSRPDEKSIMTYVASYYHTFARMKNEAKSGRRIAKIVSQMAEADNMKLIYDKLTTDLLEWIQAKVLELSDRNFPNSLEGIQSLLVSFGHYRTQEKPPKYKERSEIEALFFQINTQLKELRQPAFIPIDGKMVQDIERAWEALERAEHSREVALRSELRRQERLEQLNYKFERKSILREGYLKEMIQVLSDPRYGSNLTQVDATVKKHEAISADILARKERFHDLTNMCEELVRENYKNAERVKARESETLEKWRHLLHLLEKHKTNLNNMGNVMSLLREIDSALTTMVELKSELSSNDTGIHLLAVEELLQKHALQELQVTSVGESCRRVRRLGDILASQNPREEKVINEKIDEMETAYQELQESSAKRKVLLEDARNFFQFLQDQEDEEAWIIEKQFLCQTGIIAKDLRGVLSLLQKHKLLQDEIKMRKTKFDRLCTIGKQLITEKHPRSAEIQQRFDSTNKEWNKLEKLVAERAKQLNDAAEAYQFYADANEADSWLNEKMSILASTDYGSDEPSAQALLQRHKDLEGELNAYHGDVQSLNAQAEKLIAAGISNLNLGTETEVNGPVEEWTHEIRLVPKEVWEEEPVEKIEHKTHVEERKVPQVKALYPYTGHGFSMNKGEVMFLLNKSNPDWWSVRKADGTDGFAPANYVVEVESRIMHIQVRKPEKVTVMQKVKKTKMIKQKIPVKIVKPVSHDAKRMSDDNGSVPKRQKKINETYDKLQELATKRHALLEDAIRLYQFYRECDDFEKWMKDKEKLLASDDPSESVEQAKRKFEKFLTDLSANHKRIEVLDAEVQNFEDQNHSQIDKVRARQRQIHSSWDRLNKLKALKERSLEGASSVELFQRTCDEAKDWMLEKMTQLDTAELGPDLKTVQALQRRHQNLERELAPVEEKVKRVTLLASSVKKAYPQELKNVATREVEINGLWKKVKDKAMDRRNRLQNAVGHKIFDNSSRALLGWVANVKDQLNADASARDVQTAENLLKNHKDLHEEIKAHEDEFAEITDLGNKLLKANPGATDVAETLDRLAAEHEAIQRGWNEKEKWLQQCLQLQMFNKEADNIDAVTSSHLAYLEFNNLGESLDEVEAILKQHRAFANTLNAQDERLKALSDKADVLIAENHYGAQNIDDRRQQVLERRQNVKDLCQARTYALEASKNFQEFRAEVNDLRAWLNEKLKTASDESYRDLSNLERKLQKHEAFERELRANEGQLRTVNKLGQALIAQDSYQKDEVAKTLHSLNEEWKQLVGISLEKGRRLKQAITEYDYNVSIEDVYMRLEVIETTISHAPVGDDLRSCKDLLKKHETIEAELSLCKARIEELLLQSDEMAQEGHFNAHKVNKKALEAKAKLADLDEPVKRRREELEESLKFYKFAFEVDSELQWIKEHFPALGSDSLGQNLHQTQTLYKKHNKLEAEILGHEPIITKTVENGQALVDEDHPRKKNVENLCKQLLQYWEDLNNNVKLRSAKLEEALKAQQFFFDANEKCCYEFRERWDKLWQQIHNRERRLLAAGEIHRFHRDVAESLSRIHEKSAALGTELGRDLNSALALLRRQEAFDNELVALEAQLQVLIDDGVRLQNAYPRNKEQIQQKQELVITAWQGLKERADMRRDKLQASVDLQKFLAQARDLTSWASGLRIAMNAEESVRTLAQAQALKAEHDALKSEIEAREESFQAVADMTTAMAQTGHDAANEAVERCTALLQEHDKLHAAWQTKKTRLDQVIDYLFFLRDAKQIENICNTQEAALSGTDLGETVDEVSNQLKKHDAFEKLFNTQEERVDQLLKSADKLIAQKHFETPQISSKVADVQQKRQRVRQLCMQKRHQLEDALLYAQFLRDVGDAQAWIHEKQKKLQSEIKVGEVNSLDDKMKKLQKYQAFQAEVAANEGNIKEIKYKGETLVQKRHKATPDIKRQLVDLDQTWNQLIHEVELRGKGLEEAHDILEFNNQLDKMEAWIRDKEVMVQAGDIGVDYEHCQSLQRKLDDVDSDMRVDDTTIKSINGLANKLLNQGHQGVQQRRNNFIKKWQNLQGALGQYRERLHGASEVHLFNRDIADTSERIKEKILSMEKNDPGRSLTTVETAQRKQEQLERELTAVENKLKDHDKEAYKLSQKYPENAEHIQEKLEELLQQWNNLLNVKDKKRQDLDKAHTKQKFLAEINDLDLWVMEIIKRMENQNKPNSVAEAEALLELHKERKAEIDGRQETFEALTEFGLSLAKSNDHEVNQAVEKLKELDELLLDAWKKHLQDLTHAYQLQEFKEQADQLDSWLGSKEAFLNNDDVGETPRATDALIRKHQDFEKLLNQQLNRIDDLEKVGEEILADVNYNNQEVKTRLDSVLARKSRLIDATEARGQKLEDSRALHQFRRNIHDVENWLTQKIQIASDESYRDPSNMQSKIQKHAAFDAEILANRNRIQAVLTEGINLIKEKHFASEEIRIRIDDLENDWKHLQEISHLKRERLNDAYQALLFDRALDEFLAWLDEVEAQLKSTDTGKDLATVNNLLKKHSVLENNVQQHSENCEAINEAAEHFVKNGHFMANELQERAQDAITRYHQLQEPMQERRDHLEASYMLHQYIRDVDDELQWLVDRELLASSKDLGNSLTTVQHLQKKHLALEAELLSREPIINTLIARAGQLTRSGHNAAPIINQKAKELKTKLVQIKDLSSIRKLRLQDALEAQTYYTEAAEAETWLRDKRPLLASKEIGKDEDSTQSLQRKLEGLSCEVEAFEKNVERLEIIAKKLIDRKHFDSPNVSAKQKQIESRFDELKTLLNEREQRLVEALEYFNFIRECNELQEWMTEQQVKAASEDYGTDVEHVELLINAFETFLSSLNNSEQRVHNCVDGGKKLIMVNNEHSDKIEMKVAEIQDQWDDLIELAQARHDALLGAKQVHLFDRTADETIAWIIEKDATLALETYEQDLESIQALIRKHQAFETELAAVKEQVEAVCKEAKKLSELFPDAEEHIEVKKEDTLSSWEELQIKAEQRRNNLQEAEQLQTYFDEHRDLMAWINEMLAKITAPDLPHDVTGSEHLIERHKELKAEIDAREDSFENFFKVGRRLIAENHFLSQEIQDRINILNHRWNLLHRTWQQRNVIYEQHLDVQLFKREANNLENWLQVREGNLKDGVYGESIPQVEELLRKHDDFEKTIEAQEDKFAALQRRTLVEEAFARQKEEEARARQAEKERLEHERIAQRKRLEMQRITEQRRLEQQDRKERPKEIHEEKMNGAPYAQDNEKSNSTSASSLTKSNSVAHMFGDRVRKASDANVKRAESMKVSSIAKPVKKTPSFNTKRRAGSFRSKASEVELPPVEIQAFLERKQVLSAGGKRAQNRAWKNYYTVLCGQLLCFFKNRDDFAASKAISSPVGIHNAICTVADDYVKRKHTFRLVTPEGSEFLFACNNEADMLEWVGKIRFRAKLPPSQQLINFEVQKVTFLDYGRDRDAATKLLTKHKALELELETYNGIITEMGRGTQALIHSGHPESKAIAERQATLEHMIRSLQRRAAVRQHRLMESLFRHEYFLESEDLDRWIAEQLQHAASEDYGQDYEHLFYKQNLTILNIEWRQELSDLINAKISPRNLSITTVLTAKISRGSKNKSTAVKEQVEAVCKEAKKLSELFPDAEEHIEVKKEDTLSSWEELQIKAEQRRNNLQEAEQLQTYFDEHRDLMAWINEMLAKITAPDLPHDVTGSEHLIERHKELKAEIDAREDSFENFFKVGRRLIAENHFLSQEIQDRINILNHRWNLLHRTWQQRNVIYEQHLDVQLFKREANNLENWLQVREGNLKDGVYGESIPQVEELLRKHDDFEKTIEAQEDKFAALQRRTLVEEAFARQKEEEARARQAEKERLEHERIAQRKRLEMQRITEQRRLEQQDRKERPKEIHEEKMNGAPYAQDNEKSNSTSASSLTKSNSVAHMFGDRVRKASDANVKRAESMKVSSIAKPVKKTPSFNTKRRAGSFRSKASEVELPPVEIQAFLERKQVLSAGGKRAQNRAWKNYYTVLCGQLLCFFKNRDDFAASKAISSPVGIHNAICTVADDYVKRKHTFRLVTPEGSEFLFACNNEADMLEWVGKIRFRAKLPPSQQLINFEVQKEIHEIDASSTSSRTSSPDISEAVVLRHDPQFQNQNGNSTGWRHTLSGESPPPLPASEPPNNHTSRRYTLENSGDIHGYGGSDSGNSRSDWQSSTMSRPSSIQPNDHKRSSSRIMDLFRKKRHPSSQM
ncbi:spectrin beta chain, non-erythrocytic 1 [Agrilus planipennis]|uniref:Spectrin beta chain, non-erythrocytic 1 n=1 Tax=Agrilus planipennis TaxID=224129 RepID=A0A7F5RBB0_AGRPL|nr:spectrin beta chain, non-erythrocytic 1 [Agrilus planipennis]